MISNKYPVNERQPPLPKAEYDFKKREQESRHQERHTLLTRKDAMGNVPGYGADREV